jgi:dsDNA-specific endonuclease/ATPase MutS2
MLRLVVPQSRAERRHRRRARAGRPYRFSLLEEPEDETVEVPITDVFDLHSFAPRDTEAALEAYLEEAILRGYRVLRIIHGRGIGVRREMVREVLSRTAEVIEYKDAPAEAGGWGATIVSLYPAKRRS